MINKLKTTIETKLGRKILKRGDCQYLSDKIQEEINETLSYNTIRRVFGVEINHKIKPRESTLTILSQFVGYKSFELFNNETNWTQEWSLQIKVSGWIDRMDEKEVIHNLTLAWFKKDNFSISFVIILRELLLLGNIKLIDKIFKNATFEFDKLNYSEIIYIGNGVGSILRKINLNKQNLVTLLHNKRFVSYILLSFVDYSFLQGYYGNLITIIDDYQIIIKKDQKLFFKSIDNLKLLLSNKKIESIDCLSIKKNSLHPILVSRLASMEIAFRIQNSIDYKDVLDDLVKKMKTFKNNTDYLYELKTVSLIQQNFSLMEWICLTENKNIEEQYQVSHLQFLLIVQLLLAIYKKEEELTLNLMKKIKKDEWVLSYYSFFDVFVTIGSYHATKDSNKKKKLKKHYNILCDELNYPVFNESYLKNYFSENKILLQTN